MFRVGQKVVCIRTPTPSDNAAYDIIQQWPSKGVIYAIRAFGYAGRLYLNEIKNNPFDFAEGFMEPCWLSDNFRPLQSTETGMVILRDIARKATQKVGEGV